MSRLTNQELVPNPVQRYVSWKNVQTTKVIDGEEYKKITGGNFNYYDKNAFNETKRENGLNVTVPMPFEFAILDKDTFSYKGNDKANNNRYVWTKEISKYTTGNVELKSKEGVLYTFDIADLRAKETKDKVKGKIREVSKDIDYTQSVYISVLVNKQWEIWNLQINGGALSGGNGKKEKKDIPKEDLNDGWFGFLQTIRGKEFSHTIVVKDFKPKKNGDVTFMIPVFELGNPIETEDGRKLDELCQEVEDFLKASAKYTETKEELATAGVEVNEDLPWNDKN